MLWNEIPHRHSGKAEDEPATRRHVDDRPGCAFGLAMRRGLDDLGRNFERLEGKVNALLFGVAATLLVELWRAWR